jgi:cytochrome b561
MHEAMASLLIALALLHVAAAVFRHWVLRDGMLARLPPARPTPRTERLRRGRR